MTLPARLLRRNRGYRGARQGRRLAGDRSRRGRRQHTLAAVETLVSVMEDLEAPHSARVAAANGLLDRGHGKATQHIEANENVYDSLSFAEKEALLAVIESLDVDAADANDEATRH